MIRFIHPCHAKLRDSDAARLYLADAQVDENELDPEWLQGALQHGFVERVQPATSPDTAVPGSIVETDDAGSDGAAAPPEVTTSAGPSAKPNRRAKPSAAGQ